MAVASIWWYLQVDARLIASHVWRLQFLHEDNNDANEKHEVNLRSKEKAEKLTKGNDLAHLCFYTGYYSASRTFLELHSQNHI